MSTFANRHRFKSDRHEALDNEYPPAQPTWLMPSVRTEGEQVDPATNGLLRVVLLVPAFVLAAGFIAAFWP